MRSLVFKIDVDTRTNGIDSPSLDLLSIVRNLHNLLLTPFYKLTSSIPFFHNHDAHLYDHLHLVDTRSSSARRSHSVRTALQLFRYKS